MRLLNITYQVVTVIEHVAEGKSFPTKRQLTSGGGIMTKYTQEVKQRAVEAAKKGISLKEIQSTIGPNPKAVMRYLAKEGIDYKELKQELKDSGVLKPALNKQGPKAKGKRAKQDSVQKEEIIEE